MPLTHASLLKLQRLQPGSAIELHSANLPVEGTVHTMFEQAKSQLNRSAAKQYGCFAEADAPLSALLQKWQAGQKDFPATASQAGQQLLERLQHTDHPFTALLLVADEQVLGQHYLYLFWLPLANIIQVDAALQPFQAQSVDTGKLPYALRLQVDAWQGDEATPKYLTLLAGRGDKSLAAAWTGFTGFREGIDTSQQTREFLQIVDDFSAQLPDAQAHAVKCSIIDYCVAQDRIGQPVVIRELAEQLHTQAPDSIPTPAGFASFVSQQQAEPQDEILTHRSSLKRYIRYFGRDDSLSISFSAERFGKDIRYDPASGSLSIHRLPRSLKSQLPGGEEKNA